MGQYIPDLTERFPEGFDGVDMTDSYFPSEACYCSAESKMWDNLERAYEEEEKAENLRKENPTCDNCNNLYEEYGYRICKVHDIPCTDWDECNVDHAEKCDDWK